MMGQLFQQMLSIIWKDLMVEVRSRETLVSGLVFSLLVLLIFNFAFDLRAEDIRDWAPGVLWASFLFAGVLTMGRTFSRESELGTLDGMLLAPVDRSVIYLAKLLSTAMVMLAIEAMTLPVFAILFNPPIAWPPLVAVVALGTFGLAGTGVLFSAMATQTRAREALLPILLFPMAVPVVISTVKATGQALDAASADGLPWLGLLSAFDAIMIAVSFLLFEYVLEQ